MKTLNCGKKQPLLMYRRTVDRVAIVTITLGILILAIWNCPLLAGVGFVSDSIGYVIFLSAVAVLSIGCLAFLARYRAYVQAKPTCLSIVTPLLRLNISYMRLTSAHPMLIQQLFPPRESSWARRSYLQPFYGKTAVVVELKTYPMRRILLRLFLAAEMFSPQFTGFVIMVPDWMAFSTELDTFHGRWLGTKIGKGSMPGDMKWEERVLDRRYVPQTSER